MFVFLVGLIVLTYQQVSFLFIPINALFSTLGIPVILALFIYYALLPIYQFVLEKTSRQWLAILSSFLVLILAFGFLFLAIFPKLIDEISSFIKMAPTIFNTVVTEVENLLSKNGLSSQQVNELINEWDINVSNTLKNVVGSLGDGISSTVNYTVTFFINLFTVPVILYYFFKDGSKSADKIVELSPKEYRPLVEEILEIFHDGVSGYTSGRLILCLYVAVASYLSFMLLGLPNAILLGVLAGVFDIIPYFGPVLGIMPAILVAATQGWFAVAMVVVTIMVIQQLEGNVIAPLVMENNLSIHPLTTILVLLVSGNLFGILGMILALPVYVITRDIVLAIFKFYKKNYQSKKITTHSNK